MYCKVLKAGTLVGRKGDVGLVVGKVTNIGAKTGDVWVKWNNDLKPEWECGAALEVLSERR